MGDCSMLSSAVLASAKKRERGVGGASAEGEMEARREQYSKGRSKQQLVVAQD